MDKFPQFGLIVAYLVPGFIGLVGFVPLVPAVGQWLQPVNQGDMGFGPPIYALLAATGVGMIVSCFRWFVIDRLHHLTGLNAPSTDFSRLTERVDGLDYLAQNHFRYYEFAANTLLALVWTYCINRYFHTSSLLSVRTDLGMVLLLLVLLAASRDALAKYYSRTRQLLGEIAEKGFIGDTMYNGIGHHEEKGGSNSTTPPAANASESAKPASPPPVVKQPVGAKHKGDKQSK